MWSLPFDEGKPQNALYCCGPCNNVSLCLIVSIGQKTVTTGRGVMGINQGLQPKMENKLPGCITL